MNRIVLDVDIKRCGYRDGFELKNISFRIGEGDLLLITGPSGSGKTTLIRAITGTIEASGGYIEGRITIGGREISSLNPSEVYRVISYIPQEPWYAIIGHSIRAEICYSLSLAGRICTSEDFAPLSFTKLIDRLTYTLSAGEAQRLLWLESILLGTKVLVMDEPLVYLDEEARRVVKHYVRLALNKGVAVVLVDHDPLEWKPLVSHLLVLEGGRVKYFGDWRDSVIPVHKLPSLKKGREGETIVSFKNVWFKYPGGDYVLKGFTTEFEKHVITIITGPNGAGKTTILKLGAGLLNPSKGVVERRGLFTYIPENPLLYFTMPTPREELLASARGDENKVLEVAEIFGLKEILDRPLARLSSGERRRTAIASAYLAGYDGYFIDEPTGGLDSESASKVVSALQLLVDEGKSVVIATHDPRILSVSNENTRKIELHKVS